MLFGRGQFAFFLFGDDLLFFQVYSDQVINAHVHIGYPHQREAGNHVATPIGVNQLISGNDEDKKSNVMAETIFAGKQVEELALVKVLAIDRFFDAKLPQFPKYFFLGKCPGNTGNRYS